MVYLISGLGADQRVFNKLNFGIHKPVYLPWIIPEKNETMEHYLFRFSEKINRNEEIILIGVSFGGVVAIELSKLFPVKKIILISSIKTHFEISPLLRLVKMLKLNRIIPSSKQRKNLRFLAHYFFGAETPQEKKALDDLINDSDDRVIDWSIQILLSWKNEHIPENLFHIHGTRDRIFPFRYLHNTIPVKNGTHFMIANQAEVVSAHIQQLLHN